MRRRVLLSLAALPLAGMARAPARLEIPICRGGVTRTATEGQGGGSAEADFLEKLGLLEGHLLVGRRLLEAGESRLARPHFGHPVRELYAWLEPRIAARGVPQFERELNVMEDFAERGGTGTGGAFGTAWAALMPRLRQAQAAIPQRLTNDPRFMLEHVALMVIDVASDYGESIERGRIVNVVEYHDSMGFLMYAMQVADQRRNAGAAAPLWQEAWATMEEVRARVYPELLPPSRLTASVSWVRARSSALSAIAQRAPA